MPVLSRFQTLPAFMVEDIIGCLLNDPTVYFDQGRQVGLSLLHSCSLWRSLFIREALTDMSISLYHKPEVLVEYTKWPAHAILPGFPINHLVKKIYFTYREWPKNGSECGFGLFVSALPSDLVFESVDYLELCVSLSVCSDSRQTLEELSYILRHFRDLVPNLKTILIDARKTRFKVGNNYESYFIKHAFSFAEGVPSVTVVGFDGDGWSGTAGMSSFTDLTSFTYYCAGDPLVFHETVLRSANTLRALNATYHYIGIIDGILYNNNSPVTYPCLEQLSLQMCYDKTDIIISETVHFPVLKKLVVHSKQQNTLKILFNNHKAPYSLLEYLKIFDNDGVFSFLQDCYAFRSMQMTGLKTLVFKMRDHYVSYDNDNRDEANGFCVGLIGMVMDAVRELRCLEIRGLLDGNRFVRLLDVSQRFASVRKLKIKQAKLSFFDILMLLKAAPLLAFLEATFKNTQPLINGVGPSELLRHVETSYANLSKSMRSLNLSHVSNNDLSTYCQVIALLVIVCPNLVYLFACSYNDDYIGENILLMSRTEEFAEYSYNLDIVAKRLRKLYG